MKKNILSLILFIVLVGGLGLVGAFAGKGIWGWIPPIILVALVIRQAWGGNIRLKLVTAFTVVSLFSVSILSTVTYISYRNQVREDVRQRLLNIASITATQLDGDLHATLLTPEDMQTEAYRQMMAEGDGIGAADPPMKYSYTMRMNEQGQIYFLIDSRQANDTQRGFGAPDTDSRPGSRCQQGGGEQGGRRLYALTDRR